MKWELYLTLRNRCQILLWRGLVRRTFLITRATLSAADVANGVKAAPPTVSMNEVLALGRYLHHIPGQNIYNKSSNPLFLGADSDSEDGDDGDGDMEEEEGGYFGLRMEMVDVESAVVSLLDQGFIKGYIARQATGPLVVLARSDAFPPVVEIYTGSKWRNEEDEGSEGSGGAGGNGGNPFANMGVGGGGRVVNLSGVRGIGQRDF